MEAKRGIVYKGKDGRVILLTFDPLCKRLLSAEDAHYSDLDPISIDIVEIVSDNELIQTLELKAICGCTTGVDGSVCPAYQAIDNILDFDEGNLSLMVREATPVESKQTQIWCMVESR